MPDIIHPRRAQLVELTAAMVLILGIGWMALAWYAGHTQIIWVSSIIVLDSLIVLGLMRSGYYMVARIIWFVLGVATVLIGSFMIHPAGNVSFMFAGMAGAPFLVFSLRRERLAIVATVSLVFVSWIVWWYLGHDYFGPPVVNAEDAYRYYALPSGLSALLVITVETGYFGFTIINYGEWLRAAHDKAEAANRAKSDFLAAMSHEIRTPMNGVVGMIELLESGDATEEQKRMLRTVRESSFALLRIIDDILDVSKAEAGKLVLQSTETDLLALLENVADTAGAYAGKYKVILSQYLDPKLPQVVNCDAGRVRQILLNVLGNAIKFSSKSPDGKQGEVRFDVHTTDTNEIEFVIRDNGIGMDEATLVSIFEPFSQSDSGNTRRFGGSGLGLTIVHQLVSMMQGAIAVDSRVGEGSEFRVRLPLASLGEPLKAPDLSGHRVILGLQDTEAREVIEDYAMHTGAKVEIADTLDALIATARKYGDDAVYVVGFEKDVGEVDEMQIRRFQATLPRLKSVIFSTRPSDRFGQISATTMRVKWRPMRLSEFWAALAVLTGTEVTIGVEYSGVEAVHADNSSGRRPTILMVEDNAINQEVLGQQLDAIGYDVVTAENGAEGLELWRNGHFDIVLTDCHMPELDGFEMTTRIREIEAEAGLAPTHIIAITANALSGEADRCLAVGMNDFLSKPVRLKDLGRALQRGVASVEGKDPEGQPNTPAVIAANAQ